MTLFRAEDVLANVRDNTPLTFIRGQPLRAAHRVSFARALEMRLGIRTRVHVHHQRRYREGLDCPHGVCGNHAPIHPRAEYK